MSSSVGRNSLIMAGGTAASRITGQIRTIMLAAAIGTTGLAANAYQAGTMIPQVIYTLVSGGIFNAVLVPQIVRTLKEKNAQERLNKIFTFSVMILLAVTVIMAALTPVLTRLYVNGSPELISLTMAFTLWCTPQIFFYGIYTVLGQILAAKNHFSTYAWSSVGANIISCVGFGIFIALFGNATQQPVSFWTPWKIALTGGMWTLGVAFQALILFIPALRLGFRFRLQFGVKGIGLRSMGPVAIWSLAIVVIDQIANILCTRVTTNAPMVAEQALHMNQFDVAGNATYQNAYTIYMLPYSLIATSVATAIFPKISAAVAEHNIGQARNDLSESLRNVGLIMGFFTAIFIVMPLAIIRALLPSVPVAQALLICGPLIGLGIGLPFTGAYLIIQRTFYAFEDGKSPFLFMLLFNVLQLSIMYVCVYLTPATQWVNAIAISGSLGYIISFFPLVVLLRKRFENSLDGKRIAITYAKACAALLTTVFIGMMITPPIYTLFDVTNAQGTGLALWLKDIAAACCIGIVCLALYVAVLWVLQSHELIAIVHSVKQRFSHAPMPLQEEPLNEVQQVDPSMPIELDENPVSTPQAKPTRGDGRITPALGAIPQQSNHTSNHEVHYESGASMKPHLGDTVLNRYALLSPLREEAGLQVWKASDRVLAHDCQLFIVNDAALLPSANAVAGSLAASRDPRFTPVLQLHHDGDIAVIVTQLDSGTALSEYLQSPHPLSFEAMRAIIGRVGKAIESLHAQGLTHRGVSPYTIRLTKDDVQLADAPIHAALADTSNATADDNDERLAVRQLAATLYCMLTRTVPTVGMNYDVSQLPQDIPPEFYVICKRGLELQDSSTVPTIPMQTIAEMEALLGSYKPLPALSRQDVRIAGPDNDCSIVHAPLREESSNDILALPDSLLSSQPLPSLPYVALPTKPSIEDYGDDTTDDESVESTQISSFKSIWHVSKAVLEGKDETSTLSPEDATEMFTAFDEDIEPPLQPERLTRPINVSYVRSGLANTSDDAISATGRLPIIDENGNPVPDGAPSARALQEEKQHIADSYHHHEEALPPSFAPTDYVKPENNDDSSSESSKKRSTWKIAIISVLVLALCVALGIAIRNVASSGSIFGSGNSGTTQWPQLNVDDVPFGKGNKKAPAEPEESEATPTPTPTKAQEPVNNTPYQIASATFLNNPDGQQGLGYNVNLSQSQKVSRVIIKIRSSGGKGYLRVNANGNPTQGDQVADFTFAEGGTTEVKLNKAVDTQNIMIWVPLDSLPDNQLYIDSVEVL